MTVTVSGTTGVSLAAEAQSVSALSVTGAGIAAATITGDKLSGAQSGSAPIYGARAWVNFNGTGTVAIRASGNVSSITDNGVGDYTVNFTTAMPDVNYAESISFIDTGGRYVAPVGTNYAKAVGSFRPGILAAAPSNPTSFVATDMNFVDISIFR